MKINIKKIILLTLMTLTMVSCSTTSVLIQHKDKTFDKAQTHFQNIKKEVKKIDSPLPQSMLFLQAESFYDYRFTPPKKSKAKYLAEAMSAVTDFPGFQSLAGSLDMQDLRFRASDSAVQLWETLLQEYPNTKLKPLTLYQLGWAYRNVGAQGLPRSSDEAFDELIKSKPNSNWAVLAKEAKEVPYKSKDDASFYSIIPGAGQMYLGETKSGWSRFGIAIASLIAIAIPIYNAEHGHHNSTSSVALGLGGLIVLSFDFTNSYEDAVQGVVKWNEKAEYKFQRSHPTAP